ncbi:MAG: YdcF family protein [Thiomargarita sp.]|nr:YdcF family protein [Thiomargarita sp.]
MLFKSLLFLIKFLLSLSFLLVFILITCYLWVEIQTKTQVYSDINDIPTKKVALLLGTAKYLREGRKKGYINRYFKYRIQAVVQLFQSGKIKYIIASGDNRTKYYNEPVEMRKSLIEAGIPKEAITLDYAGFRTFDSIVRCQKVFSQDDIIIVSQEFHNERAIFIANFFGIKAIGFNAQGISLRNDLKTPIREYFARLKAVLDLYVLKTQAKFLGEKVNIHEY